MTYNITKPGLPPYSTVTSEAEAIADCEEANRIICPGHEIYRQSDGAYMVEDSTGGLCEYVGPSFLGIILPTARGMQPW